MLNVLTVFLSGVFGLAVAVLTFWLSTRREHTQRRHASNRARYERIENLYAETIASLEKTIRYTERMMNYSEIIDELSRNNARLKLSAPPNILKQIDGISDLMYAWSTEYRHGQPQRLAADLPYSMISSDQAPHREKAQELFPKLHDEVVVLIDMMRQHLSDIDPDQR